VAVAVALLTRAVQLVTLVELVVAVQLVEELAEQTVQLEVLTFSTGLLDRKLAQYLLQPQETQQHQLVAVLVHIMETLLVQAETAYLVAVAVAVNLALKITQVVLGLSAVAVAETQAQAVAETAVAVHLAQDE